MIFLNNHLDILHLHGQIVSVGGGGEGIKAKITKPVVLQQIFI